MKFDLKEFFFTFIQEIERQNSKKFLEENIDKIEFAINQLSDFYKNYPKWIFLDEKNFDNTKNINSKNIDNFKIISVGDIHADYDALKKIIEIKLKYQQITVIFLGDYVDRGDFSFEVFLLIIILNLLFFDTIYILPGNHELYHYFKYQNAEFWNSDGILSFLFKPLRNLIEYLPLLISFKSILFIHGGFFDFNSNDEEFIKKLQNEKGIRLNDFIKLNEKNVFEIVWADYAGNYQDITYSKALGRPVKTEEDILRLQKTFNIN
ncbi:MAG: metallophosphoesterase family protein, partial [Exilispira sp.]